MSISTTKPTLHQTVAYLQQTGKKGANTVSYLGRHEPFMQAIQSPLGQELLKDLCARHEQLLEKVGDLVATDEEKGEFKAVKKLIHDWSERIAKYDKALQEVKSGTGSGNAG